MAATVNRHSRDGPQYLQNQTESLRKCSNKELSKINQTQVAPINRVIAKEARIYNHAFLFKDLEPLQLRLGMFSTLISNHQVKSREQSRIEVTYQTRRIVHQHISKHREES